MPATKHIQHAPPTKTKCDYLYGSIKNGHMCKDLTKSGEPQRYSWERMCILDESDYVIIHS